MRPRNTADEIVGKLNGRHEAQTDQLSNSSADSADRRYFVQPSSSAIVDPWDAIKLPYGALEALRRRGFSDPLQLLRADLEKVAEISGIGPKTMESIRIYVAEAGGQTSQETTTPLDG